ncbi:MAG: Crp/Fnr family transcriptional regulator [Cytophagaceae bacterium]|nr:Crp/Fnr family transcriptional regulator [Cytophagaceae bacterium]
MGKALHISCSDCHNEDCVFSKSLSTEGIKRFEQSKNSVKYSKGQFIFLEGSVSSNIFCIYQGKVKVIRQNPDGREQIVYLAKPGDVLALKDNMTGNEFTTSACVMEDAVICNIPKNIFHELIDENPLLYKGINNHLCRVLNLMEGKVINFSLRSVRERVAINILNLNEDFGIMKDNEIVIDVSLSREDMAGMVGTATETVIRVLSDFKKEGMVDFVGKKMTITNLQNLRKVAAF